MAKKYKPRIIALANQKGGVGKTTTTVVECEEHLPGRDAWLLIRRSIAKPDELAFYLSNAGAEISLKELAKIAATRLSH